MRLIKRLAIMLVPVMLAACGSSPVSFQKTQTVVIQPPEALYVCPKMTASDYPTGNFQQSDAAVLITKLQERGDVCQNALDAIHKYVDESAAANVQGAK